MILHGIIPNANSAPLVSAHPGADLRASVSRSLSRVAALSGFCYARLQQRVGELPVSILGPLGFAANRQAGRNVLDDNTCLDLVPVLATGAGAARRSPLKVAVRKLGFGWLKFWHDRDRDCRCLDAPASLGRRNSLPAMPSGLVGESRFCSRSFGTENHDAGALLQESGTKDPSEQSSGSRSGIGLRRAAWRHRRLRLLGFQR